MDMNLESILSNYKRISVISETHNVYLLKDSRDGNLYVCKVLSLYNADIYSTLKNSDFTGVPRIHEIYQGVDNLIVIEEYLRGCTLEEMLELKAASGSHFTEAEAVSYALRLCDILQPLHSLEPAIVHRDIKPSNIMVLEDGRLCLIDFNAAKFESPQKSEDTMLLGTRGYAAPEQYGFGTSGIRTDIYAIGILMNEMLTGEPARTCPSCFKAASVINRCTDLKYENRLAGCEELKDSLLRCSCQDNSCPESDCSDSELPESVNAENTLSSDNRDAFLKKKSRASKKSLKPFFTAAFSALFLYISMNIRIQGSFGSMLTFERICTFISLELCLLFTENTLNIQHLFRIDSIKNKVLRYLLIAFADLLIIFAVYTVMVEFERIAL